MKNKINPLCLLAALAATLLSAGCSLAGTSAYPGAVPNKFDNFLFDVHTNVVTVTNLVQRVVPVFQTNQLEFTVTNQQNQTVITYSNIVTEIFHTNLVAVEAQLTNYDRTVKPVANTAVQAGGAVVNTFLPGVGGLVSTGLTALLGFLAYLRSSKQGTKTTTALAQEVETIREFVQAIPGGAQYDAALVSFLQAHQQEAGVATQVLSVLDNYVSNPDAKVAAQEVINTINALKPLTAPLPNIVPNS